MAFTMHSHSGQFCPGHAVDQLEAIVQHAIAIGYKTMALTEHMPRTDQADLYPEELKPDPHASLSSLFPRHADYLNEALRLQAKYADRLHILIAFEGEWLRGNAYAKVVADLYERDACVDFFIGSVHHVADVPLDYDRAHYRRACAACAGSAGEDDEAALFATYFDAQLDMLRALRPRVVGHFDLVRLMSSDADRDLRTWKDGPGIWAKVVRNLEFVKGYGGWLELNTAALRKGLAEPYPARSIAETWLAMGGLFTFSDDSHGIAQVATNYVRGIDYLVSLGVKHVMTFERATHPGTRDGQRPVLIEKSVPLTEFRASLRLGQCPAENHPSLPA